MSPILGRKVCQKYVIFGDFWRVLHGRDPGFGDLVQACWHGVARWRRGPVTGGIEIWTKFRGFSILVQIPKLRKKSSWPFWALPLFLYKNVQDCRTFFFI